MVEAGTLLQNRYLIQKQIGAGGMGTVYVATDQRFNSPIAIKETLFDEDYLQHAFEREAQLLNSLRHPALPHVIDYFAENARQYLVMEYFAGDDLSEILKQKGSFPVAQVLHWADDLLDALDYLHSQTTPVVHRDIKPQNLKLTQRGEIILLDFGLAKGKPGEASQISRTHSVFGYSRNYAPLEQIQGTGTDTRSDIYSFGATIYHLLTGKPPVDALTRATAFVNNQPDPLVPANVYNQKIQVAVAGIVQQALNLNPDLRPQTASQMRVSLQTALSSPEIADPETTKISRSDEKFLTTTAANNAFFANLGKAENSHNLEIPIVAGKKFAEKPFAPPSPVFDFSAEENQSSVSLKKFASIATAILILAGGCFAAWYATSQNAKSNTQIVNSNSIVVTAPLAKPSVSNSNAKAEEKAVEKTEEKDSNLKAVANTFGVKSPESSNKTVPIKTTDAEPTREERPALEPIVVKSAPPTGDSKRSTDEEQSDPPISQKKSDRDKADDSEEDVIDTLRKQKKADDQSDQERIERRERRAPPGADKRRKQKLPSLLGAP